MRYQPGPSPSCFASNKPRDEPSAPKRRQASALVADIGGTNARFALADLATLQLSEIRQVLCADHPNLAACPRRLCRWSENHPPDQAAIAVAAPVTGADYQPHQFQPGPSPSRSFAATSGLRTSTCSTTSKRSPSRSPHLARSRAPSDRRIGAPVEHGTKAVLGPGTGLGVAGLSSGWGTVGLRCRGREAICRSAPRTSGSSRCLRRCARAAPHLSAERALSGPGLAELYYALVFIPWDAVSGNAQPNDVPLVLGLSGRGQDCGRGPRPVRHLAREVCRRYSTSPRRARRRLSRRRHRAQAHRQALQAERFARPSRRKAA